MILVFDLGNVVLTNDWHYYCPEKFQSYSKAFGITEEGMEKGWNSFWRPFFIGKITEDEFWAGFLEEAGANSTDVTLAKQLWREYQKPIAGMLELLADLKKRYRLGALSNISKEWLDFKRKRFSLDTLFETIVSSGQEGIIKQDPALFAILVERMNVSAHECIYIDDRPELLKPAEAMGMKTILFKDTEQLSKRLNDLGIQA